MYFSFKHLSTLAHYGSASWIPLVPDFTVIPPHAGNSGHNGRLYHLLLVREVYCTLLRQAGVMALKQMGFSQFAISHVKQTSETGLCPCSFNSESCDQIMKLSCQSHAIHVSTLPASAARFGSAPAAPSFRP